MTEYKPDNTCKYRAGRKAAQIDIKRQSIEKCHAQGDEFLEENKDIGMGYFSILDKHIAKSN